MPELPEAETIARALHRDLAGRRLGKLVHLRPDIILSADKHAPHWLEGACIERVDRRGKRVVVHCDTQRGMIIYLGMTGRVSVQPARTPPPRHTHLRVAVRGVRKELRFSDDRRFGGIRFFERVDGCDPVGIAELGIEPLEMTLRQFRALLTRRRQIKALLMDQSVIAGMGNIYCDEALHRAGIHPLAIADEIDPARSSALGRAIKAVLRASIRSEGTTIINYQHPDGSGHFQRRLRVYGRDGEPCRRCGAEIVRIIAAGRSTHFCPACQPADLV